MFQSFSVRPRLSVAALMHDGGATVLAAGHLVAATAPKFTAEAGPLLVIRPPSLAIDVRAVTLVDDLGADAVRALAERARAAGIDVRLHCLPGALADRLAVDGSPWTPFVVGGPPRTAAP